MNETEQKQLEALQKDTAYWIFATFNSHLSELAWGMIREKSYESATRLHEATLEACKADDRLWSSRPAFESAMRIQKRVMDRYPMQSASVYSWIIHDCALLIHAKDGGIDPFFRKYLPFLGG